MKLTDFQALNFAIFRSFFAPIFCPFFEAWGLGPLRYRDLLPFFMVMGKRISTFAEKLDPTF